MLENRKHKTRTKNDFHHGYWWSQSSARGDDCPCPYFVFLGASLEPLFSLLRHDL